MGRRACLHEANLLLLVDGPMLLLVDGPITTPFHLVKLEHFA